jgi:sorbitol-specific phosphotransferase system component IIBC
VLSQWKALLAVFVATLIGGLMLVAAIKGIPLLKARIGDGALIALVVGTALSFFVISMKIAFFPDKFFLQLSTSIALVIVLMGAWLFICFVLVLMIFRPSGFL